MDETENNLVIKMLQTMRRENTDRFNRIDQRMGSVEESIAEVNAKLARFERDSAWDRSSVATLSQEIQSLSDRLTRLEERP